MYEAQNHLTTESNRFRMASRRNDDDLTPHEIELLRRFADAIQIVRKEDPAIQAWELVEFIAIAVAPEELRTQRDLMERLEIDQNTMSNDLKALGPKRRSGKKGLGLLESKRRMDDMRVYDIFFTPRGRLVLRNVIRALTGKPIAPMPKKED